MLAIFSDLSNVGAIGSMRSARPYYIELAMTYDAIFVHAGGSEQAYSDISVKHVNNMDGVRGAYGGEIFYREPSRQQHGIEHSLFTTGERILKYTPILGYEQEHQAPDFDYGLTFDPDLKLTGASPASSVEVSFGGLKTTSFTYNSNGCYTGAQFGSTYIDGNTGEAVQFKNLMVLYAQSRVLDDAGRRSVELTGTGKGLFFCNGEKVDITWTRGGSGELFRYYLEDGSPLTFGVGRSYIAIVPTGSNIVAG
jgi:hypothetical protein